LPIIGRLLGHSHAATTARYAHLDNDPLRRASEAIADPIAANDHANIKAYNFFVFYFLARRISPAPLADKSALVGRVQAFDSPLCHEPKLSPQWIACLKAKIENLMLKFPPKIAIVVRDLINYFPKDFSLDPVHFWFPLTKFQDIAQPCDRVCARQYRQIAAASDISRIGGRQHPR
jgi:hypothetical protein